mmetsp:Transcript_2778/g.7774  ORF Transcript_2778/g.7774 Transcript_2778/m.7774 type:complete len:359 (+) Transcript_2778:169-1245(+)
MASDQTVLDALGAAMWDPQPTGTDLKAQQLAYALGYPTSWRVVRTIEEMPPQDISGEEKVVDEGGPAAAGCRCIVDRIYAGEPGTGCDMWFHHHAAMMAAQDWNEDEGIGCDPFQHKGGHLLPRQAAFEKGDKVEVLFENQWYEAKIVRRKEHSEGFRYTVSYTVDKTKQTGIPEEIIREFRSEDRDPRELAMQLGLGEDWEAVPTGNNRWKITAPNGKIFTSKKAALAAISSSSQEPLSNKDDGDPPWRTTDHEYLGRLVKWTQEHAVTARRKITVEQIGRVAGWISESDVDKAGEPGFISEKTGQPAKLFHVVFEDEPHMHPYASYLVAFQDFEEFELEQHLIPEDEVPSKKRKGA